MVGKLIIHDKTEYSDYYDEEDLASLTWKWDFGDEEPQDPIVGAGSFEKRYSVDDLGLYTIRLTLEEGEDNEYYKEHDYIIGRDETLAGFSYTAEQSPYVAEQTS